MEYRKPGEVDVRRHRRKIKNGSTIVRKHTRSYEPAIVLPKETSSGLSSNRKRNIINFENIYYHGTDPHSADMIKKSKNIRAGTITKDKKHAESYARANADFGGRTTVLKLKTKEDYGEATDVGESYNKPALDFEDIEIITSFTPLEEQARARGKDEEGVKQYVEHYTKLIEQLKENKLKEERPNEDTDGDGVINKDDCHPLDKDRQDNIFTNLFRKKEETDDFGNPIEGTKSYDKALKKKEEELYEGFKEVFPKGGREGNYTGTLWSPKKKYYNPQYKRLREAGAPVKVASRISRWRPSNVNSIIPDEKYSDPRGILRVQSYGEEKPPRELLTFDEKYERKKKYQKEYKAQNKEKMSNLQKEKYYREKAERYGISLEEAKIKHNVREGEIKDLSKTEQEKQMDNYWKRKAKRLDRTVEEVKSDKIKGKWEEKVIRKRENIRESRRKDKYEYN